MISKAVRQGGIIVDEGRAVVPDLFMELAKTDLHVHMGIHKGDVL